ncbi:hypothetical protein O3M35_012100 [Rhynocoris fuscipes]|uniref:Phlebovirus glycoprotein G2 fusion domain-containing protein n=1 Tax=Rhynocoris fuscipes TaxID=488301 RepID=A0AAW1CRZ2_9HEMI
MKPKCLEAFLTLDSTCSEKSQLELKITPKSSTLLCLYVAATAEEGGGEDTVSVDEESSTISDEVDNLLNKTDLFKPTCKVTCKPFGDNNTMKCECTNSNGTEFNKFHSTQYYNQSKDTVESDF